MSRRRANKSRRAVQVGELGDAGVHHDYGAVRFVCPDGHVLTLMAVMDPDTLAVHLYGLRDGAQWLDTPAGGKLTARCALCERAGRRPDLQASWPKVLEALRQNAAEPDAGPAYARMG